jgi:hypothetical protein
MAPAEEQQPHQTPGEEAHEGAPAGVGPLHLHRHSEPEEEGEHRVKLALG